MKRATLAAGGCVVVGLLAGVAWPPPPIPRSQLQEPEWSLPPPERVARWSAEAYESTTAIRWNGEAAQAADPETSREWGLAGILATPEPVALITRTGGSPEHVRIDEPLPDGSTLVGVNDDKITTRSGTCERVYQLHRRQALHVSEGCSAATGSNTGNP